MSTVTVDLEDLRVALAAATFFPEHVRLGIPGITAGLNFVDATGASISELRLAITKLTLVASHREDKEDLVSAIEVLERQVAVENSHGIGLKGV